METPAARVRFDLKLAGFSRKDVSVRMSNSTVRVTVLRPGLPVSHIEEIARKAESIRRDEDTGEIRDSANTYVDVERAPGVIAAESAAWLPAVVAAAAEVCARRDGCGNVVRIGDHDLYVMPGEVDGLVHLRMDGCVSRLARVTATVDLADGVLALLDDVARRTF